MPKALTRLFIDAPLKEKITIPLSKDQSHYCRNVLRLKEETIAVFNGKDGEYSGQFHHQGKKESAVTLEKQIKKQKDEKECHLYFPPIKGHRLDFIIEKATELGITDLHPMLTERTVVRRVNTERLKAQAIEASEQCKRLSIPTIHPLSELKEGIKEREIYYLDETKQSPLITTMNKKPKGYIVGPEGGFTDQERTFFQKQNIQGIQLGERILRTETAVLATLAYHQFNDKK